MEEVPVALSRVNHLDIASKIYQQLTDVIERDDLVALLQRAKKDYHTNLTMMRNNMIGLYMVPLRHTAVESAIKQLNQKATRRDVFVTLFNQGGWYPHSSLNFYIAKEIIPNENLNALTQADFLTVNSYLLNLFEGRISLTLQAQQQVQVPAVTTKQNGLPSVVSTSLIKPQQQSAMLNELRKALIKKFAVANGGSVAPEPSLQPIARLATKVISVEFNQARKNLAAFFNARKTSNPTVGATNNLPTNR
jgi:hypothetical protein